MGKTSFPWSSCLSKPGNSKPFISITLLWTIHKFCRCFFPSSSLYITFHLFDKLQLVENVQRKRMESLAIWNADFCARCSNNNLAASKAKNDQLKEQNLSNYPGPKILPFCSPSTSSVCRVYFLYILAFNKTLQKICIVIANSRQIFVDSFVSGNI